MSRGLAKEDSESNLVDYRSSIEALDTVESSSDELSTKPMFNEKDRAEIVFCEKYSATDVYINGEDATCWHPWTGTLELKPLRFDTQTGTFVVLLKTPVDAWLGKHRHRGTVTAVTISGEWNYKEYVVMALIRHYS
jgi:2,4'-dihydroxyacetophenone dioxygenase